MSVDLRQVFEDLVRFEAELRHGVDARLRQAGAVPLGSLGVLQVVARTPGCRVNDIAEALGVTIGGASQAVDRLAARDLLARRPNPADRRSSLVELTDAGAAAIAAADDAFDAALAEWFGGVLTGSALRGFARSLAALRAARVRGASSRTALSDSGGAGSTGVVGSAGGLGGAGGLGDAGDARDLGGAGDLDGAGGLGGAGDARDLDGVGGLGGAGDLGGASGMDWPLGGAGGTGGRGGLGR